MQWFARGKLWASREAERDDFQTQKHAASAPRERRGDRPADSREGAEKRGSGWRPGGAHADPRDRFKKKNRPERAWSEKDPATQRDRDKPGYAAKPRGEWRDKPVSPPRGDRGDRPWSGKPSGDAPRGDRPPAHRNSSDARPSGGGWRDKPAGEGKRPWSGKPRERKPWNDKPAPPSDRPWQTKPTGPRAQRKPRVGKPNVAPPPSQRYGEPRRNSPDKRTSGGGGFSAAKPRGDRPWRDKPASGAPQRDRPWSGKPAGGAPRGDRPWRDKPAGGPPRGKPQGDRPPPHRSSSDARPSGSGWSSKPPAPGGKRPWSGKPPASGGGQRPWSGKPRDPNRKPFTPRGPRPGGAPGGEAPRKRREDED